MGAYFTWTQGVGVTRIATFTHSLSITPGSLVARVFIHQATNSCTNGAGLLTIGTNVVTVGTGVSTLTTVDIEVQMPHSIIT